MKRKSPLLAAATLLLTVFFAAQVLAADNAPAPIYEYVTIRWGGRENTHVIRPGGKVEFVGSELRKVVRPDRSNDRSFFMNAVMNGLSKEGYEFAGMTNDEIVMKRAVAR